MYKNSVATQEDIVRIVSDRLGVDEDVVLHVLKGNVEYMQHLSRQPDVYSINVPNVGKLIFNCYNYNHLKIKLDKYGNGKNKYVHLYKQLEEAEGKCDFLSNFRNEVREKIGMNASHIKHFKKELRKLTMFNGSKRIEEIEKQQNEVYEKNIQD